MSRTKVLYPLPRWPGLAGHLLVEILDEVGDFGCRQAEEFSFGVGEENALFKSELLILILFAASTS